MKEQFLAILFTLSSLNVFAQEMFDANEPWKLDSKKMINLPLETVQSAFNAIKSSGLEFRYPQGGCQQRAEMIHMILDHYSIPHARVFIFAPTNLVVNDKTNLEVSDPNGLSQDNTIKWPYHVAPCVAVTRTDGKTEIMVIDPALDNNSPISLIDWFGKMKNANISKYTIVKPDTYFFYTDNNSIITGDFYRYEDLADANMISTFDNAVLERELAINDVALFLRNKLNKGYSDPHNIIKPLLSSVNNMVGLFASQNNNTQIRTPLTIRALLEHHPSLMNEAMKFYTDRVTFWSKKYTELKTQKPVQLQMKQQTQPTQKTGPQQPQRGEQQLYKKKKAA